MTNQELLNNITTYMSDYISVIDEKGTFSYVSESHSRLGYAPEDLLNRSAFEVILEEDHKIIQSQFDLINQGHTETKVEYRYKTAQGEYIWLESFARVVSENEIIVSSREVTDRKKTALELKRQHKHILSLKNMQSAMIDNNNDVIAIVSKDMTLNYISANIKHFFGWTVEDISNIQIMEIISTEEKKKFREKFNEVISSTSEKIQFESSISCKEGITRPIELSCRNLTDNQFINGILINITDITSRKVVELEIQESETRYRALHNASFAGIALHRQGEIIECNKSLSEITGYSKTELTGMDGLLLIDKDYRDDVMSKILSGFNKPYETIGLRKNGESYPLHVQGRNIPYNGEIVRVVEFRDISKQKQNEKELKASREEIELKNDISNAIILSEEDEFFNDILNILLKKTGSKYGLFGYLNDKNVLICPTMTYDSWNECQMPNKTYKFDKEQWGGIWGDALIKKKTIIKNKDINIPDGHLKLHNAISIPILHKNKTIGLILLGNKPSDYGQESAKLLKDIANYISPLLYAYLKDLHTKKELIAAKEEAEKNAQQLAEQQLLFHTMFNTIHESIIITDKERNIIMANNSTQNMFGYSPNELIGESARIYYPNDEAYNKLGKHFFNRNSKRNTDYFQTTYRHKDGHDFEGEVFGTKLFDNSGKWIGNIAVSRDITNRLSFIADLQKAKKQAEESSRLKTEFINNMSHEIRTPMNGIIGFSEMLGMPNISDEKRKYFVQIIQNSSEQLLKIIDDILEISILETNKLKINLSDVCLNQALMEVYSKFSEKAKEKKIPIYINKPLNDLQSTFTCDRSKLVKILSNLLTNAIKYTHEGQIDIGYRINNKTIDIYVKDTGTGIAKENQVLIFDRFAQAEKEISNKKGGLGLGLSISKANAELLNGDITVDSELNNGATFTLTLPYDRSDDIVEQENIQKQKELQSDTFTILVAEDEEVNFLYLEAILESEYVDKHHLLHAKNGQEAVDICSNEPHIDLVLMDIKMPYMNGHQATRIIKEKYPELIVIAQTAYSTEADIIEAKKNGCDDFITKPINKDDLIVLIEKYINTDKSK